MTGRVFIFDDDADLGEELCASLIDEGFDARSAATTTAILAALDQDIGVIVLDLSMPLDGFDLVDELNARGKAPEIVISSGQDQRILRAAVRHAEQSGLRVAGVLAKPYSPRDLIAILRGCNEQAPTGDPAVPPDELESLANVLAEVSVVFQPKVRLNAAGTVAGYEALLRWRPGRSPERLFERDVPAIVQRELTASVIRAAGVFYTGLLAQDRPVPISVNITPALLCDSEFTAALPAASRAAGLPSESLVIELTEHASLIDFSSVASAASRLVMRGFHLAMDDFGRGSTSLERIIDLPVSELKIDKEIFWSCASGDLPAAILRETIAYCHDRSISVTVEGIETDAHAEFARSLGAELGQGFLWGRPASADLLLSVT